MDQSNIDNQTDEAMGWAAEGKKLAVDIPEVSFKDAATFVAEMTPIVGDAMAAKDVYDELQKDEPNYYLAGALGGAALVGLIPGIGDIAAKAIRKGAKEVFDVAKRVEVDTNAMGSGLGNVRLKPKEVDLPPAENAARTQIAGTLPTYKKADTLLTELSGEGKTLDFGAGLGLSKKELGFDTYEPFPKGDFTPDFNSPADIPSNAYKKVTNLNVLNVVPREVRDGIVKDIGRVLEPNGRAVITTRGRDVMDAKGTAGPEPMSIITSRDTYQKGFTQPELSSYITETLGEGFEVTNNKLGAAGVTVHKLPTENFNEGGIAMNDQTVRAFALGGLAEDVDPVSGNEVPVGSMPEEVRDDIPAQLSEGEYVVPADVVRFFGVKFFEDIRAEAKKGFANMEANGRVGGEPMGMEMGGDELPFDMSELQMIDDGEPEQPMMNKGGYMSGYSDGGDASQMVNPLESQQSSGNIEIREYVGPNGQIMYIQFMNGNPLMAIPQGFNPRAGAAQQVAQNVQSNVTTEDNNPEHEAMMANTSEAESINWAEEPVSKFQETFDEMHGIGSKVAGGIAGALTGGIGTLLLSSAKKKQTRDMIKGLKTQLANADLSSTDRTSLIDMMAVLEGDDDENSGEGGVLFNSETYKGNSIGEGLANLFTSGDGASYVNGQLVDDKTGEPISVGSDGNMRSSKGIIIKGTANDTTNDSSEHSNMMSANTTSAEAKAANNDENRKKLKAKSEKAYQASISTEDDLESTYGYGLNKGGLMKKKKK